VAHPARLILGLLLAASLASGVVTLSSRIKTLDAWRSAPPAARDKFLFGLAGPAIVKVRSSVPEDGSLLLIASLDPALFPYYLHPRRIFQCATEPETDRVYMDKPPSPYPWRPPSSFAVDAILVWDDATRTQGGVLRRGGARP
jgi:hypothetical protein